ncbi:MAG: putative ABC transporter ATP-binding protein [Chloroflexi bacterium ADurb.Bin180]|nr:MAG: putative ABC transporter ATP-binding protein [Chloroflexi bacterium ADurb.Bin180]
MGFVLDGLETEAYDRTYRDRDLLRRIAAYLRPHTRRMVLVSLALALNTATTAAGPILVSRTVDTLLVAPSTRAIVVLTVSLVALGIAGWALNFVRQWYTARVVGDVVLKLRQDVFSATVLHDLSFFDEHPSGKIVSRITSDTQDFSTVVTLTIDLASQVLQVLVLTLWLVKIEPRLALLLMGMTPISAVIALSFRRVARRVTLHAKQVTAKINADIQESISGIMVAKSFRQEQAIFDAFHERNQEAYRVGLRRGLTLNTIFPILGISSGIATSLLVYIGGLATRGGISPGDWLLFMQTVGFYWWPIMSISSFWSQFQDGLSAAERVFALVDAEPKVIQSDRQLVGALEGQIDFHQLRLSYTGRELVLPGLSLHIRPRETVALVGHTGAGKSSLARLLARFYEFQDGSLLIDGRDIRTLDLHEYRQRVGLVPQEPFLFSGSIRDNIRYGCAGATDEQVLQAATRIGGGDWLSALPDGLDTDVGERGASLSTGQRQLVALSRVLLKDPPILILDEATASVDPFTEAQIQEGLAEVMKDRTAVVIAHRLSTVRNVDRIIVLRHGEIIEEGNHETLLAARGHYAELYNTYFRHQSIEYMKQARHLAEPGSEGQSARSDTVATRP